MVCGREAHRQVCDLCGPCVGRVWAVCGPCVGRVWAVCGTCVGRLWDVCETCARLVYLCKTCLLGLIARLVCSTLFFFFSTRLLRQVPQLFPPKRNLLRLVPLQCIPDEIWFGDRDVHLVELPYQALILDASQLELLVEHVELHLQLRQIESDARVGWWVSRVSP